MSGEKSTPPTQQQTKDQHMAPNTAPHTTSNATTRHTNSKTRISTTFQTNLGTLEEYQSCSDSVERVEHDGGSPIQQTSLMMVLMNQENQRERFRRWRIHTRFMCPLMRSERDKCTNRDTESFTWSKDLDCIVGTRWTAQLAWMQPTWPFARGTTLLSCWLPVCRWWQFLR